MGGAFLISFMKALKNFYGESKGDFGMSKYYEVGDEVEESEEFMSKLTKLGLVGKSEEVPKKKKVRKYSTKNAAPNTEDKGQKKTS